MAKVRLSRECPICKKPVGAEEKCILVAIIRVRDTSTYGCYLPREGGSTVRPIFPGQSKRVVYHLACFPGAEGFNHG